MEIEQIDTNFDSLVNNNLKLFSQLKSPTYRDILRSYLLELSSVHSIVVDLNSVLPNYENFIVRDLRAGMNNVFTEAITDLIHTMVFSLGVPSHYGDDPFMEKRGYWNENNSTRNRIEEDVLASKGGADYLFLVGISTGFLFPYIFSRHHGIPMMIKPEQGNDLLNALAGSMFFCLPSFEFEIFFTGSSSYLVSLNPGKKSSVFKGYGSSNKVRSNPPLASDMDVIIKINRAIDRNADSDSKSSNRSIRYIKYTRYFTEKTLLLQGLVFMMRTLGITLDTSLVYSHSDRVYPVKLFRDKSFKFHSSENFDREKAIRTYLSVNKRYQKSGMIFWISEQNKGFSKCPYCYLWCKSLKEQSDSSSS
jgi:hypothetical protein